MPNSFSKSSRAEADLDQIWLFIATDNISAADRLLDRIGQTFLMLADNPQAGRERPELGRGIRSFPLETTSCFMRRRHAARRSYGCFTVHATSRRRIWAELTKPRQPT
ncbi:MAG: type II toxin-antitoxin system RelE/ParE family toxin [Tardiphaga sp.]